MKGKERLHLSDKDFRHLTGLSGPQGLHGQFYKGIYYDHGVPQISKEKQAKQQEKFATQGNIFIRDPKQNLLS